MSKVAVLCPRGKFPYSPLLGNYGYLLSSLLGQVLSQRRGKVGQKQRYLTINEILLS
jgi:hypothetical protein